MGVDTGGYPVGYGSIDGVQRSGDLGWKPQTLDVFSKLMVHHQLHSLVKFDVDEARAKRIVYCAFNARTLVIGLINRPRSFNKVWTKILGFFKCSDAVFNVPQLGINGVERFPVGVRLGLGPDGISPRFRKSVDAEMDGRLFFRGPAGLGFEFQNRESIQKLAGCGGGQNYLRFGRHMRRRNLVFGFDRGQSIGCETVVTPFPGDRSEKQHEYQISGAVDCIEDACQRIRVQQGADVVGVV